MTPARFKMLVLAAILVSAAGAFIFDVITPAGLSDWVWYVIPLLLSLSVGGRFFSYLLAAVFSVLILMGWRLSPPGIDPGVALVSRGMGIAMLWLMAVLISQRKRVEGIHFRTQRALETLSECNQALVRATTEPALLQEICRVIVKESGYRFAWVGFASDDEQKIVQPVAHAGYEEGYLEKLNLIWADTERGCGPTGSAIRTGQPAVCRDSRTDQAVVPWRNKVIKRGYISAIALPLLAEGKAFGALNIYSSDADVFDAREVKLLTELADDLAYGLQVLRARTKHQQTEETLAAERALMRTLIDNLPDCIYAKDAAGRKILANPADLKNLRCKTEAEAIGKTDYDLFPKDIAEKFHADDQKVIQGQPVINREEYVLSESGEKRWLMTSKLPLRDQSGKIVGLVGIGRDITERRQAEQNIANERALLRTIISNSPDAIYIKDITGRKTMANPAELKNMGCETEAEALGKSDFEIYPRDLASGYFADDQAVIQTGKPVINREEKVVSPNGEVRWILSSKIPLQDAHGKIVGLVGMGHDITERKRTEEHIRDQARLLDLAPEAILVRNLEDGVLYWNKSAERIYGWTAEEAIGQKVRRLLYKDISNGAKYEQAWKAVLEEGDWHGEFTVQTKSGQEMIEETRWTLVRDPQGIPQSILTISADITEKKKLETQLFRSQRMKSLGTLAGGIAHDLNNVLTPLLISIQLLREKITDADGGKMLDSLEANALRGAGLVKQVLAFGRGVEGERVSVNPRDVAREIIQIILETFPKSLEHEFHSPANLWTITGDPTQLHQVLLNLCINARDAMPAGGKLSIQMENVVFDEISARTNLEARPGPYVCIKVADTGAGIPKEIRDRIFDPFFTTKEPGKGTGLGLSTTLAIVKSHGGFIQCYSEVGRGSTFMIYLPANTAPVATENPAVETLELPRGHDELVLVVDDEEPIREMAQRTLERYGYRVLLAAQGAEAVSLYKPRQNEIDVVVTDMIMPVMDGFETIRALKTVNPDVRIIGSSGLASRNGLAKAKDAGVRHFLSKPYTAETMLRTLHEVLNAT
ncbi:MAG TPA: PAS domain-containing protein [Verrucomicrobiae bacterium]|nr:PAS domain-containing protein [Verrucomicrobiae bacterium]